MDITTFKKIKHIPLIIGFGIMSLFIITDIISNKISKYTITAIGIDMAIIFYFYGDISNKAWPIIISFIVAIINIIIITF